MLKGQDAAGARERGSSHCPAAHDKPAALSLQDCLAGELPRAMAKSSALLGALAQEA